MASACTAWSRRTPRSETIARVPMSTTPREHGSPASWRTSAPMSRTSRTRSRGMTCRVTCRSTVVRSRRRRSSTRGSATSMPAGPLVTDLEFVGGYLPGDVDRLVADAAAAGHDAVLVATHGPGGRLVALNRSVRRPHPDSRGPGGGRRGCGPPAGQHLCSPDCSPHRGPLLDGGRAHGPDGGLRRTRRRHHAAHRLVRLRGRAGFWDCPRLGCRRHAGGNGSGRRGREPPATSSSTSGGETSSHGGRTSPKVLAPWSTSEPASAWWPPTATAARRPASGWP